MGAKGETLFNLWKGDVNFRDPQIQIHSSTFLHFFLHIIHMYISNDSNVISKYFHFVLLVVFFSEPQFYTAHVQQRTTFVNCFSSSMIMRFTKINNMVHAIFIYLFIHLFMLWCHCFNCWQSFKFNMGRLIESV